MLYISLLLFGKWLNSQAFHTRHLPANGYKAADGVDLLVSSSRQGEQEWPAGNRRTAVAASHDTNQELT
tara:strand:- start:1464 stop:1670 length:207 start_codon:yes stop_codon:yes gene_type:complete